MRYTPHEYQRRGIEWIKHNKRCCLFWEMGLGKSVVTLTAVRQLIDALEVERVLVVAPKKVAESTWTTEATKWDHLSTLRVSRVMGTAQAREAALQAEADVYVIGRDSMTWLLGYYKGKSPFDTIVIDELTSFKNPKAQRFKAMKIMTAAAARVIGLTGTPAPNGLIDLWAQMYCIDGGRRLGKSITAYRREFFDMQTWNNIIIRCTIKPGREKIIQNRISDICLTMSAADYISLPGLIEIRDEIELPANIVKGYRQFEKERIVEFQEEHKDSPDTVVATNAAALMSKLSQYANGAIYDEDGNWHEIHDEKIQRLCEIVESVGESVLVFYQYKHDVERIMAALKQYRVRRYESAADLQAWNSGEIDVLLAHPASTAYGLNMQQGGRYIVWFGVGWNLELYQQANARLHRQGQQRRVTVYQLLCKGTVDERTSAAIENKGTQQRKMLDALKDLVAKYCV